MREILFRGKRVDNGEWIIGSLIEYFDSTFGEFRSHHSWIISKETKAKYEVDVISVGQFTGLLDKNGKQVFEGDIIRFEYADKFYVGKIVFECGAFGLVLNEHFIEFAVNDNFISLWEIYWHTNSDEDCIENIEIIGNIHDNPELLEDK